MPENFHVLSLALLPALGNFCSGLMADFFQTSRRNLNRALHAAAGVIIAIIAFEIMPEAIQATSVWVIAPAFALGGSAYVVLEAFIENFIQKTAGASDKIGMWMIYVAVATDLFSDGLMIGAGSTVSPDLALILTFGQVLADVPEGFATIANFKNKGVPRAKRILISASFAVPVLLAAILAFYLLRRQSTDLKMGALVFTAGLLTVAAVEDMISEAHEAAEDKRSSVLAFIGGFVLFILVTAGMKSFLQS